MRQHLALCARMFPVSTLHKPRSHTYNCTETTVKTMVPCCEKNHTAVSIFEGKKCSTFLKAINRQPIVNDSVSYHILITTVGKGKRGIWTFCLWCQNVIGLLLPALGKIHSEAVKWISTIRRRLKCRSVDWVWVPAFANQRVGCCKVFQSRQPFAHTPLLGEMKHPVCLKNPSLSYSQHFTLLAASCKLVQKVLAYWGGAL